MSKVRDNQKRIVHIKYLVDELENFIDGKRNCNFFYHNSYEYLVYSEYQVKQYLKWTWTPYVVYIPFQYKGEEVFIVTSDIIQKRLV